MKNYHLFWVIATLASITLLSSCGAARQARQLLQHQEILTATANDTLATPEEKLDVLMTNMTGMMHEGMRIVNPKKGVNYVTKFGQQNMGSIEQILGEVANWQKDMKPLERIGLGLKMAQKPYAKDAVALIPKFARKYQRIKFVGKMTGKLKSSLMGMNFEKLGVGRN